VGEQGGRRRSTSRPGASLNWKFTIAALVAAAVTVSALGVALAANGEPVGSSDALPLRATPSLDGSPAPTLAPAVVVPGRVFKPTKDNVVAFRERMQRKGYAEAPPGSTLTTEFTVSSFNVLGAGHTARGGDRKGYASGDTRIRGAVSLIRDNGVSVVGLQEFQSSQYRTFAAIAGDYGVWPALDLGNGPVQNSIAWRKADWEFVEGRTSRIPYFGGHPMAMPHILLRNLETGRRVWFANYHNPADAHGPAQRWRDAAAGIESALARSLTSDGTPMIITGDMNDRAEYACRITGSAPMHSADGANSAGGGCHLPRRMNVDWIFGSTAITFGSFVTDDSNLVDRTSDHPMVRARASIASLVDAANCIEGPKASKLWFCPKA